MDYVTFFSHVADVLNEAEASSFEKEVRAYISENPPPLEIKAVEKAAFQVSFEMDTYLNDALPKIVKGSSLNSKLSQFV
jgi:hypothetical protein